MINWLELGPVSFYTAVDFFLQYLTNEREEKLGKHLTHISGEFKKQLRYQFQNRFRITGIKKSKKISVIKRKNIGAKNWSTGINIILIIH